MAEDTAIAKSECSVADLLSLSNTKPWQVFAFQLFY